MNKKYLLIIPIISIFFVLLIIILEHDIDSVYEPTEFQTMLDKIERDLQFIENNTSGVSTREIKQAYSNANDNVEKAITMLNEKNP
jgi:hypothetical protein